MLNLSVGELRRGEKRNRREATSLYLSEVNFREKVDRDRGGGGGSVSRRGGAARDQSLPRIIQCYRYHKFGGGLFSRGVHAARSQGMILINYRASSAGQGRVARLRRRRLRLNFHSRRTQTVPVNPILKTILPWLIYRAAIVFSPHRPNSVGRRSSQPAVIFVIFRRSGARRLLCPRYNTSANTLTLPTKYFTRSDALAPSPLPLFFNEHFSPREKYLFWIPFDRPIRLSNVRRFPARNLTSKNLANC